MSDPTTENYISAIQDAKDNGHAVSLDFDNLPDGVDQSKLVAALSDGLPDGYHQAISDASDGGHALHLDFAAVKPQDSMANHPIVDALEKTAELGGMAAGGMAGAGAGALTSPVTGPVGPIVGSVAGAGLGYGAVKSGADALNQTLGFTPPKSLPENAGSTVDAVKEGAVMQAAGEGAGAVIGKGIEGAKAAFPYITKVLKTLPKPVAEVLVKNPDLPEKYSGTPQAIDDAVGKMQDGLKTLKQKASDMYDEVLNKLQLGGPKTASEAATKLATPGQIKVLPPKDIGASYLKLVQDSPNMSDVDKLTEAIKINRSINATTKWAKAGQDVKPIANDLAPTLQKVKDGVMQLLKRTPGGDSVINADATWHAMRQVYDTLQPQLADTGKAVVWLTKVASDEGTASATAKQAMQTLDAAIGEPVSEAATNHVIVGMAKRPLADSMMGKMGMILALAHPGSRMLTLPVIAAAQSPLVQSTAMRGIDAAGEALAQNPTTMGPMIQGLYKGAKALNAAAPSSRPSLKDD